MEAATPLKVTAVAPLRFLPLIVTSAPTLPLGGLKLERGGRKVEADESLSGVGSDVGRAAARIPAPPPAPPEALSRDVPPVLRPRRRCTHRHRRRRRPRCRGSAAHATDLRRACSGHSPRALGVGAVLAVAAAVPTVVVCVALGVVPAATTTAAAARHQQGHAGRLIDHAGETASTASAPEVGIGSLSRTSVATSGRTARPGATRIHGAGRADTAHTELQRLARGHRKAAEPIAPSPPVPPTMGSAPAPPAPPLAPAASTVTEVSVAGTTQLPELFKVLASLQVFTAAPAEVAMTVLAEPTPAKPSPPTSKAPAAAPCSRRAPELLRVRAVVPDPVGRGAFEAPLSIPSFCVTLQRGDSTLMGRAACAWGARAPRHRHPAGARVSLQRRDTFTFDQRRLFGQARAAARASTRLASGMASRSRHISVKRSVGPVQRRLSTEGRSERSSAAVRAS